MTKFLTFTRVYNVNENTPSQEQKTQEVRVALDSIEHFRRRSKLGGDHRTTIKTKSGTYLNVAERYKDVKAAVAV